MATKEQGARIRWKRRRAGDVLGILWTIAFLLFLLVLTVIVVPVLQRLEQELGNETVEERPHQDGQDKPGPEVSDVKQQGNLREHRGPEQERPRMNPH